MREILGKAKNIHELLSGVKYSIDYYQREYKWETKHVRELIEDLSTKFLQDYKPEHKREAVEDYGHYFLGAIIISRKDNMSYIVDGQQRLTTITLLLIFLNNLQRSRAEQVKIDELVYSERYGKKSFNLHIDEREPCMEALFDDQAFDDTDQPESVQSITARYADIGSLFPEELTDAALLYFIDWLLWNVHMVEITAYSDDDAYTVFETMNDRGLSLSPTDMLKGYVLANITDVQDRRTANAHWKKRSLELNKIGKETDADCIKAWLRSQYAQTIRERKKGAHPEDFDRIGTEFHRWVRDFRESVGLHEGADFLQFIERDFAFYSQQYLNLMRASTELVPGLERVFYNANHGFTLQYMLLLAPLKPGDTKDIIDLKLGLVSAYIDILITWRLWNFRSIAYSTMQYAMFLVMREIRALEPADLATFLRSLLEQENETFANNDRLYIHQQNQAYIHRMLARMTDYLEQQSGFPSRYKDYVKGEGKHRYEIEHIWANKHERFTDEFPHPADFAEYRNRLGGLLLLPKQFNASYGDLPYVEKLPHYFGQNILAKSLHSDCYNHNPGFLQFVQRTGLPFQSYAHFKKADLDERQRLYRAIAEQVWNPAALTAMVDGGTGE